MTDEHLAATGLDASRDAAAILGDALLSVGFNLPGIRARWPAGGRSYVELGTLNAVDALNLARFVRGRGMSR